MKQITLKTELRHELCALEQALGTPVYLVGGCVRNALLGLPAFAGKAMPRAAAMRRKTSGWG